MFYKKNGMPENGEIVLCTVKKVLHHSVFVSIDEYNNLEGMVHISEVSPGRIRNIRDYVKEGKRIVCKVLDINKRGNIDLSLRRVGTGIMLKKMNEIKQEEKAEKLLIQIGKEFKNDAKKMYDLVGFKAIEEYGSLYNFFQAVVEQGERVVKSLNIEIKLGKKLVEVVKDKIKPVEVCVSGILNLKTFSEEGIENIKKLLVSVENSGVNVSYLGAPRYKLESHALEYKKAESILDKTMDILNESCKKLQCEISFIKNKND